MSVFLDANIVIYLIERPPHFGSIVEAYVRELALRSEALVVSDLIRMECRIRPLRLHDAVTLSAFDGFFDSEEVVVAPVTSAVCDRAAAIRARYAYRPMDSLHLAAAVESGCSRFLTHDVRLNGFSGVAVEVLS